MSDCITWAEGDINWNLTDFTWSEICLLVEVVVPGGGGYSEQFKRLRRKDRETQKTFIKLLCKIKGEEYEESKYFSPNVSVTANDFRIVEKELKKIKLNVFINK